jgi:hypothetical protein
LMTIFTVAFQALNATPHRVCCKNKTVCSQRKYDSIF